MVTHPREVTCAVSYSGVPEGKGGYGGVKWYILSTHLPSINSRGIFGTQPSRRLAGRWGEWEASARLAPRCSRPGSGYQVSTRPIAARLTARLREPSPLPRLSATYL